MRIAVIGGGFAGVEAIKTILKSKHTPVLFEPKRFFSFTPLLHEVAGGVLDASVASIDYKTLFPNLEHINDEVVAIDDMTVKTKDFDMKFDAIIIATGSRTKSAPDGVLLLKTIDDAHRINEKITSNIERANKADVKEASRLLHCVMVGGGSTGVEMAGEVADLMQNDMIKPQIILLQSRGTILPAEDSAVQKHATRRLRKKGVDIITNARVESVKDGTVTAIVDGKRIEYSAGSVIWTVGVQSNGIGMDKPYSVDEHLRFADGCFAAGDVARLAKPQLALAQVAVQQGRVAAKNAIRHIDGKKLLTYDFKSIGTITSIGQYYAVGRVYGIFVSGFLAWFIMRTVYLLKFHSIKHSYKTAVLYTARLFVPHKRD